MKKILVHIGAHKTGTTHFQDTLSLMNLDLSENGITYLSRQEFRPRLDRYFSWGKREQLIAMCPLSLQQLRAKLLLIPNEKKWQKLFISEENLLGTPADLLLTTIYPNAVKNLRFLKALSCKYEICILAGIRSFDRILPAAYATAIKFEPEVAINRKNNICKEIELGRTPSWIDFFSRVKEELPQISIKIWTQEDYSEHSSEIIRKALNIDSRIRVPDLPPPRETVTPSKDNIKEIEKSFKNFNSSSSEWLKKCEDTITSGENTMSSNDKYTFLENSHIDLLKIDYKKQLTQLKIENYFL